MWLSDLRIVLADRVIERGAIRIDGEQIAEVLEHPVEHSDLNVRGMTLIPGIIDMHGDMLEREIEPRPKAYLPHDLALHELDKRLSAAGVTTAYAAVSFSEISVLRNSVRKEETARAIADAIHDERDHLLVDMRVHARFEVTNRNAPPVLLDLLERDRVHLVSLNDHTPGQGQYRDLEAYYKMSAEWRNISADYAEEMTQERMRQLKETPIAWDVIREVTRLARERNLPIASHDDDTPEKVALMHDMGVTISEFPVTMEAAREARRLGMHVAMGAPNALRGVSTSGNLSARDAVAAGVVDMLAADYHPGALLQAAWLLAKQGILSLPEAVRLVSTDVALGLGLADRGAIAVGMQADLALVAESPRLEGGHPRVCATLRAGRPIYLDRRTAPHPVRA
ncbi:MAG: alpha-D-ribose 1-methylphosphonate 5-triphosphate diphosphatase [Chloroflexi bacterium]|nr:alpha-D-ribose 1-methylphosphonate 5-triphosphate diphosphatase [Chloroflexota bacterium]